MAEGLFSGLGFESPEKIRERISRRYQTEERARYEAAAKAFAGAGSHAGRMSALGQQLGMTLRGAFSKAPDVSEHPEVRMAQQRQDVLTSIDLNDPLAVAEAGRVALEGEDIQMGTWLYDRANKLAMQQERIDFERDKMEAARTKAGTEKLPDVKHWQEGLRTNFKSQVAGLDWVDSIDDDTMQKNAINAIVGRAEDLWNARRTQGLKGYTMTQAVTDATNFAKATGFDKGTWGWGDEFNMDKFNQGFVTYFDMEPDKEKTEKEKKAAVEKVAKPKLGEVRDGYRFIGGDPKDPTRWKPVGGTAKQPAVEEEDDEDPYDIDF